MPIIVTIYTDTVYTLIQGINFMGTSKGLIYSCIQSKGQCKIYYMVADQTSYNYVTSSFGIFVKECGRLQLSLRQTPHNESKVTKQMLFNFEEINIFLCQIAAILII